MKEITRCSISGIAFTLEHDAYELLNEYLDTLKENYASTPGGDEIVADIETHIAELILSHQDNSCVVERPLVEEIIRQMGSAEEIRSDEPAAEKGASRIPRRFFRDATNAKLGGVCSGLARYFDTDPVWIRIGFFTPLLLCTFIWLPFIGGILPSIMSHIFGTFVLAYILLWIAIPIAKSPRQKLEMQGQRITEQSIRETASRSSGDEYARSILTEVLGVVGKIVVVLLKILIGVILFVLIATAGVLLTGLFFGSLSAGVNVCGFHLDFWATVTSLLAVLTPVILLIYVLLCLLASRKPGIRAVVTMFVCWFLLCIAAGLTIYMNVGKESASAPVTPSSDPSNLMNQSVEIGSEADKEFRLKFNDEKTRVEMQINKQGMDVSVNEVATPQDTPAATE